MLGRKNDFLENFAEELILDILFITETHLDEQIDKSDILLACLDSFSNNFQWKDRTNAGGGHLI